MGRCWLEDVRVLKTVDFNCRFFGVNGGGLVW